MADIEYTSEVPLKKCTNPECGKEYPATTEYFYRTKNRLTPRCRDCVKAQVLRYQSDNYEKARASSLRWKHENPEKHQESNHRWYKANPEKIAQYSRKAWLNATPEQKRQGAERAKRHYYDDPERKQATSRKWKEANRERYRITLKIGTSRHRTRKLNLPNTLTAEQWTRALAYFNGCCAVCERPLIDLFGSHTVAMDHWIPIKSPDCPGTIATNIVPLCHGEGGCNNRKSAIAPDEWLTRQFGKHKAKQILAKIQAYFDSLK